MKKMASMQVYMPVDAASRQALDRQMISWDENLERLHVEQYQLRCYLAALQGSADLPSTKVPQSLPRRYLSVVVAHFRNWTSLGAVARRTCMAWWCNAEGVGRASERSPVRLPAVPLSDNNHGQVVHTLVPLSSSSIIWYRSIGDRSLRPNVWRRSHAVIEAVHVHIHLQAHGLGKGNEHPAYTPHGAWHILPLPYRTRPTTA